MILKHNTNALTLYTEQLTTGTSALWTPDKLSQSSTAYLHKQRLQQSR